MISHTVFTHGWLTHRTTVTVPRGDSASALAEAPTLSELTTRRRRAQAALGPCSLAFKMASSSAGLCMLRAVQCCGLGVALLLIVVCVTPLRRGVAAPDHVLLPQDDVVRLHGVTVLVGPSRRRAWNTVWYHKGSTWCLVARADDSRDISPRCESSFLRWGAGKRDAVLALRKNERLHQNDGSWLAACSSTPTSVPSSAQPARLSRNLETHCSRPVPSSGNASLRGAGSNRTALQLGDPKVFVGPNGSRFFYGYTRGGCSASLWQHLPPAARIEYRRNAYRNFFCPEAPGVGVPQDAALLHYKSSRRPELDTATAKNFLLFTRSIGGHDVLLAIALIAPHRVYRVNSVTGHMSVLATSHSPRNLGFRDPIGLSAGPVPVTLPDGRHQLLVAAHIRRGSWSHHRPGVRMTFFYTCDTLPPFDIQSVTPLVNFGYSASLEYTNHMELHSGEGSADEEPQVFLSVGVEDCASVLLRVPLATILRLLRPVPSTRIDNLTEDILRPMPTARDDGPSTPIDEFATHRRQAPEARRARRRRRLGDGHLQDGVQQPSSPIPARRRAER